MVIASQDAEMVAQAIDDDDALDIRPEREQVDGALTVYTEALQEWLKDGLEHAQNKNRAQRAKMRVYRQRRAGRWGDYAGSDKKTRIYRAMIGKLIDVYKAIIIPNLIPNPDSMDWLNVKTHAPGFDAYASDVQAVMRRDFVMCYPETDESYVQQVDAALDDYCGLGNTFSTMDTEVVEGDVNLDGHVSVRPTPKRLSCFDVLPWDVDVDRPCQTNHSVWTPKTEDEIVRRVGLERAKEIFEKVNAIDHKQSQEDGEHGRIDRDMFTDVSSHEKLYPGWIHYVKLPIRKVLTYAEGTDDEKAKLEAAGLDGLALAMSLEYNFDLPDDPEALPGKWWEIETVGKEIILARPYPLRLLPGMSPIVKAGFAHINGQYWDHGFFDIAGVDESAHNRMNAAAMKLAELAADPPMGFLKQFVDPEYLAEHGGEIPPFMPAMRIPLKNGLEGKPFEVLEAAFETLTTVIELRDNYEAQLRTILGISTDLEGQSKARTATQNVNNVQFGMAPVNYRTLGFRSQWMYQHAVRAYLAKQQTIQIIETHVPGYREYAPIEDTAQTRLRTAAVTSGHFIDIDWLTFEITGPDQESSRVATTQQLMDIYRTAMPSGQLNGDEVLEEVFKTLRKTNPKRFLANYALMDQNEALQNLMAAFGPQVPDHYMAMIGLPPMMPPPVPGEPGAESEGGEGELPGAPNVLGAPEPSSLPSQPIQNYEQSEFRKASFNQ